MNSLPFKTKIPENLKPFKKNSNCTHRRYCLNQSIVNPLLLLCQNIVDFQPEPSFWNLSIEEVAELISQKWNHNELQEAFIKNKINGKSLILIEADILPKMNIKQFEVIKELTSKIRDFCTVEKRETTRGISLPYRYPYTLYLLYKATHTGPTSYYITFTNYMRKIHIIQDETTKDRQYYSLLNHWSRISSYRPWCPHVLIGGIRRINPMTGSTQRQVWHPKKCSCIC